MNHDDHSHHVVADDRERSSAVVEALAETPGVTVMIRRLALGDYLVDEALLVERKTVRDFAVSLCDGRLFRQASSLATHLHHRVCFVLEGTTDHLRGIDVSRDALQGAMITLTLIFGLPVLRARHGAESASLMLMASHQLRRRAAATPARHGWKPKSKQRIQLLMLQAVPGIGPKRARALLDAFGNIESLLTASAEEIEAVPLLGSHTSQRLKWVLSDPAALSYLDDDLYL